MEYNSETPMPFGKEHYGKPLKEVPASYFIWMAKNVEIRNSFLKKYIDDNMPSFEMQLIGEKQKAKAINSLNRR